MHRCGDKASWALFLTRWKHFDIFGWHHSLVVLSDKVVCSIVSETQRARWRYSNAQYNILALTTARAHTRYERFLSVGEIDTEHATELRSHRKWMPWFHITKIFSQIKYHCPSIIQLPSYHHILFSIIARMQSRNASDTDSWLKLR